MARKKKVSASKAGDDLQIAEIQWNRYVRARDYGHLEYMQMAKKCSDFYRGEQWDPAIRKKLEDLGKPVLEINMILSSVNVVLGEQTSKRCEFKYKPRNGGTEAVSTVLSKLVATIKDNNRYDYVESQVFSDGVIEHGRGFFDIRMDWETNIHGDIKILANDPRTTLLDPDAKDYDPTTWKEVIETSWMSIEDIEAQYGQAKADELRQIGATGDRFSNDSIMWDSEDNFGTTKNFESASIFPIGESTNEEDSRTLRSVRVVSRQHVKMVPMKKYVDMVTGDMSVIPETWNQGQIDKLAQEMQLGVVEYTCKKVRWTTTADKVVLHDDWSPYKTFTKIPFFCYFRRGKPFGLVSNLISPQEQLNKLSSQELHILNTTANSGWLLEVGSLNGMTADDLRNVGAEDGLVLEFNTGRQPPAKIPPNNPPAGIERAASKSAQFIKEISGINEALLGTDSPEVSGVALEQKQFQGQVQMQVPFDNLNQTRHMVSKKIIELVQQFYTEERVFKTTTYGMDMESEEDQQYLINHQTASGEIINDLTIGTYDTVLSMVPARDAYDDSQFAEAINLRNIGVQIPDDRIIEYSHLARKDELAEESRQASGRGKQSEEQQAQAQWQQDIQKRLMEAEVAAAEANVGKINAEMQLAQAKAMSEGQDDAVDGSAAHDMKLEELQVKLTNAREMLQLRRDMAEMSHTSQSNLKMLDTKSKIAQTLVSEQEKRKTALLVGAQSERTKRATALLTGQQRGATDATLAGYAFRGKLAEKREDHRNNLELAMHKAEADVAKEKAKPKPKPAAKAK